MIVDNVSKSDYWIREKDSHLQIDWDSLGFNYHETDFMFVSQCGLDGEWEKGDIQPFGPLNLSPSAGILSYGQVCAKKKYFF